MSSSIEINDVRRVLKRFHYNKKKQGIGWVSLFVSCNDGCNGSFVILQCFHILLNLPKKINNKIWLCLFSHFGGWVPNSGYKVKRLTIIKTNFVNNFTFDDSWLPDNIWRLDPAVSVVSKVRPVIAQSTSLEQMAAHSSCVRTLSTNANVSTDIYNICLFGFFHKRGGGVKCCLNLFWKLISFGVGLL